MIRVIVDTNFLMQYRMPAELPWASLLGASDLKIILVPKVMSEVDNHKSSPRKRLQRRARQWSSLLATEDVDLVLREDDPRIVCELSLLTGNRAAADGLDKEYADHRILLQALEYRDAHAGDRVVLLSGDTYLRRQARLHQLEALAIPEDWRLDDEPDEAEIENRRLKAELQELKDPLPKVEIDLRPATASEPIIQVAWYAPLDEESIQRLTEEACARNPMATFGTPAQLPKDPSIAESIMYAAKIWTDQNPTPEQIEQYTKTDYPAWRKKVEDFFRELHRSAMVGTRGLGMTCMLENSGGSPANSVAVRVSALGNLALLVKADSVKKTALHVPAPPPVPKRQDIFTGLGHDYLGPSRVRSSLDAILQGSHPDPDRFRWSGDYKKKLFKQMSRDCGLWRHRSTPEEFGFHVVADEPADAGATLSGAVTVRVEATNLRIPVERTFPIKVAVVAGNIHEVAEQALWQLGGE